MRVGLGKKTAIVLAILGSALVGQLRAEDTTIRTPGPLDFSMFFLADVHDSPECRAHVDQGKLAFGEAITNPALTCPGAFAWKLFGESVTAGFWENWSTNRQVWPSDPWPRCRPGEN